MHAHTTIKLLAGSICTHCVYIIYYRASVGIFIFYLPMRVVRRLIRSVIYFFIGTFYSTDNNNNCGIIISITIAHNILAHVRIGSQARRRR